MDAEQLERDKYPFVMKVGGISCLCDQNYPRKSAFRAIVLTQDGTTAIRRVRLLNERNALVDAGLMCTTVVWRPYGKIGKCKDHYHLVGRLVRQDRWRKQLQKKGLG